MRIIDINDTFTSASAPTTTSILASGYSSYASTAAFVTAKGSAAADGDAFYNTTTDEFNAYTDGAWTSLVTEDDVQTMVNKALGDSTTTITDNLDPTKVAQFQASGITTGTTRTFTFPDANVELTGDSNTQTLTNKTLTAPVQTNYEDWTHVAAPGNPSAGFLRIYAKSDNQLYTKTPAGIETALGAGGGGGGSMVWNDDGPNAPLPYVENSQDVYWFAYTLAQELFAAVKVPSTYIAGNPIALKISIYSIATSGTILMQSVATLIRTGTDALTSTTNQRTSTNVALTNTVASQLRTVSLDLTHTDGTINSVAVAPNDLILVKLTRGTDTDVEHIRFLPSACETTFK